MSDDDEELMELDSLVVVEICLKCGRGDDSNGKLLVCSAIGCPISVHEECMCCRPEIDDEDGKFYCPYCAHKRAVVRSRKLKNKAMMAREFLSMYIDSGDGSGVEFAASDGDDGENVDKGGDGGDKGSLKNNACVNEGDGLDRRDEDSVMVSEEELQPAGEAVVPESGDFYLGSPVLRKRRLRQRGRRRPFAAIPLRMVPSPSSKSFSDKTDDAVEEDAEKHSEKDTVSSSKHEKGAASSKSRDIPEPNKNDTGGTSSSESRDIPDVHRTKKTWTSSLELRDIPNLNHSTTSSSKSRDIPDLNKCEKATTFSNESRDIPELNKIEKATTFSSKSRDMLRWINIEKDTTSSLKSRKIPDWNRNENDSTSFFKSRNVPDSTQNKKTTATTRPRKVADLKHNENTTASEPRKVPDSKQNEKTTASASEPRKIWVSESEDVLFHNANAKRRRINWTDQELQTLKDGVKMFTGQVNKNLPWRKILEYGKDVFHETRNPDNLKDKWKNLTKEASNKKHT